MRHDHPICRDCGTLVFAESVRYAQRHSLCVPCACKRGALFFATLRQWQLENLPHGPLKAAGLLEAVMGLIKSRKRGEPPAPSWPTWLQRARMQAFMSGIRRVPAGWYREQYAVGATPVQAAEQIRLRRLSA